MKKIVIILGIMLIVVSCSNGKNKLILGSSTGRINSILVVVDNSEWAGKVGKTLREIFNSPVRGLSQPEAQFNVSQIRPSLFNSLFQNNRNILIVGIESKAKFKVIKNKYASPQIIMTIIGKNKADLINNIKLHQQDILSVFKRGDLALYQQNLAKKIWPDDSFKELKNLHLIIPRDYLKVEDKPDFLWLRKHLAKDGMINILVYKVPINQKDTLNLSYIIRERNIIGKTHIPGQFKGTYMQTSTAIEPFLKTINVNGITALVTKGLWNVKKDFMGGPFVNYTFLDKGHNQLICLDGFVYYPNQNKRDYIFELEAIFRTLEIK